MLLMCAIDLFARAQVTNMPQFNGKFGCLHCLQPGQTPLDNNLIRYWSVVEANTIERKCLFMDFGSPTRYIICVPSTRQN